MARVSFRFSCVLLGLTVLTGCLFHSRKPDLRMSTAKLRNSTAADLIQKINTRAAQIKTLNATVDIAASVGGSKKGKITDYQQIRGYILIRQPDMFRMIGLFPVVRNRAFDMVSDGRSFKLWIPTKNKFYTGANEVTTPAANPLENLRPGVIYDAFLLQPIDEQHEIAVLENDNETVLDTKTKKQVLQPDYVLDVIERTPHGWYLARKITFSRIDLQPDRQVIYDQNGYVASDVRYEDIRDFSGFQFPQQISIWRPQEEYSVTLGMVKLQLNEPLKDDQFALAMPPGAQLVQLGNGSKPQAANGDGIQPH